MSEQKGRVALITGGGKGVGAGIARVLCAHGMRACVGYHTNEAMAKDTLQGILDAGGEAFLFQGDVSNPAHAQAMIAETTARYGGVDVLVNNAAMQYNQYLDEYDTDTFTRLWNINIGGYCLMLRGCLPYLKKSACPRVVNISSIHGKRPTSFDVGYAMTKGAIRMFTREMALEMGKYGITVNAIDLGACKIEGKTGGHRFHAEWPEGTRQPGLIPTGRISEPEDVGALVWFLAQPEAGQITGAGIRLDGGGALI